MAEEKEEISVVLTDDEGNEIECAQVEVIPFQGKQFAVLVVIPSAETEEEPEIILSRMDTDENGEVVYVPPTDEEYDAVADIYDAM